MLLKLGTITAVALALLKVVDAKAVGSDGKILQVYYADWTTMDPEKIPFDQVTHVNYAFATLKQDHLPRFDLNGTLSLTPGPKLKKLVTAAHSADTKVLLSIGGWAGSTNFSPMAADKASGGKRDEHIKAVSDLVKNYDLDGVDIDWEHPGMADASQTCNIISSSDYDNYISLLTELKKTLGSDKKVTIAAHLGGIKQPIWNCRDLSSQWAVDQCKMTGLADALDWVNIMTYDFGGPWNTYTGPNSPLFAPAANSQASFKFGLSEAITRWVTLGVPKNQLVVGVPFYGRSTTTTASMASLADNDQYIGQSQNNAPKGDDGDILNPDKCDGPGYNHYSGAWKWKNLRSEGVLTSTTKASSKWQQHWDPDTHTNWLWNADSNVYLSYDDPRSLTAKIDHLACSGVLGTMVWEISHDNGELLPALQGIFKPAAKTGCSAGPPGPQSSGTISSGPSSSTEVPTKAASTKPPKKATRTKSSAKKTPTSSKPAKSPKPKTPAGGLPSCTQTNNGDHSCTSSKKSPAYAQCVNGQWSNFSCVSGTVCVQNGKTIYCDHS